MKGLAARRGRRRRRGRQHLRRDGRGGPPGAPGRSAACARENPGARIVVTGCAAQTEPETFAAMPEVDLVLGNAEKLQRRTPGRALRRRGRAARVAVGDIMAETRDRRAR